MDERDGTVVVERDADGDGGEVRVFVLPGAREARLWAASRAEMRATEVRAILEKGTNRPLFPKAGVMPFNDNIRSVIGRQAAWAVLEDKDVWTAEPLYFIEIVTPQVIDESDRGG